MAIKERTVARLPTQVRKHEWLVPVLLIELGGPRWPARLVPD